MFKSLETELQVLRMYCAHKFTDVRSRKNIQEANCPFYVKQASLLLGYMRVTEKILLSELKKIGLIALPR